MRHYIYHIMGTLLLLVVSFQLLKAQGVSRKDNTIDTVERYTKAADKLFEAGKYYAAANLYGKVLVREESAYLMHRLAEANRLGRFYSFAELWYSELSNKYPKGYPLTYYKLGLMYKANGGKYQQAIEAFKKFLQQAKKQDNISRDKHKSYINRAKKEIKTCQYALSQQKNAQPFRVYNMGTEINKKESEFGAVLRNDTTLLFTGAKEVATHDVKKFLFFKVKETYDTVLLNRLYKSFKKGKYWQERALIYLPLAEKKNYDVGSPTPLPYESSFLLTMCKGSFGNQQCSIYKSTSPSAGQWRQPQRLANPINAKNASTKNPMVVIHQNDTILYFSSDREGGEGGFDIWASRRKSGHFQPPTNLGPTINTPADEVSPFYDKTQETLYFSSSGHPSFGQFDIFKTKGHLGGTWDSIQNLGPSVNGPADDYYYIHYKQDGQLVGYFSSNRTGGQSEQGTCCDDIYFFRRSLQSEVIVKGSLVDQQSGAPVKKAYLTFRNKAGESIKKSSLGAKDHFQTPLPAASNNLHIEAPSYEAKTLSLADKLNQQSQADTLALGQIPLSSQQTSYIPPPGEQLSEAAFKKIIQQYGDQSKEGLIYKIQVGAFSNPSPQMFSHFTQFGPLTRDTSQQGLIKFMIGRLSTLNKAISLEKTLQREGASNAWIVVYYKGQRITVRRAIQLLSE